MAVLRPRRPGGVSVLAPPWAQALLPCARRVRRQNDIGLTTSRSARRPNQSQPVQRQPPVRRRNSEVPLAHDGIEALIEDALTARLPVVLVIEITPQFEAPAADGEIMLPPLTSAIGDYHAVLVTGASTD